MTAGKSRTALFIAVPLLILFLPVAVWATDKVASAGEIPRNVSIAGVPVGGLSQEDAALAIRAYEAQLQSEPAAFSLNGTTYQLVPTDVGLAVDVDTAVAEAMGARSGGLVSWFRSYSEPVDVPATIVLDDGAVAERLAAWEEEAITDHAYDGMIEVVAGRITFEYPRDGLVLDTDAARDVVFDVLADPDRAHGELPVAVEEPQLTDGDIDAAVEKVKAILDRPVTLRNEFYDFTLTFVIHVLAEAVEVEFTHNSEASIEVSLDPETIASYVEARRQQYEIPPENAGFDIDIETDVVTIIPSKNGTRVDPDLLMEPLMTAALSEDDMGEFPVVETVEPEFTTEDAEAFGPLGLVSEFTTNTPGVNRVHNIHLMADTLDGYVVWPGEEFSINEVIGQRTLAKGYLRDGAIIGGEIICCDEPANVGGGVSQYGTTIFNAIWFGCYEIMEHTPHSLYISRYPEGREATLGFPQPDVRFRNDTDAPVIIRNTYDGNRDITVKFYGNNGGRICEAEKGERFNFSNAPVKYEPDPSVEPGTERVVSNGSRGWSITVTRVINHPDGTVERQPFTHSYRGDLRKIQVHPCDMPGSSLQCPVAVPGVVGQGEGEATSALTAAGFKVSVSYQETTADRVGEVLAQSPGGGTYADPGSSINIVVGVDDQPDDDPGD